MSRKAKTLSLSKSLKDGMSPTWISGCRALGGGKLEKQASLCRELGVESTLDDLAENTGSGHDGFSLMEYVGNAVEDNKVGLKRSKALKSPMKS